MAIIGVQILKGCNLSYTDCADRWVNTVNSVSLKTTTFRTLPMPQSQISGRLLYNMKWTEEPKEVLFLYEPLGRVETRWVQGFSTLALLICWAGYFFVVRLATGYVGGCLAASLASTQVTTAITTYQVVKPKKVSRQRTPNFSWGCKITAGWKITDKESIMLEPTVKTAASADLAGHWLLTLTWQIKQWVGTADAPKRTGWKVGTCKMTSADILGNRTGNKA